jgi:hypothetical protein
MDLLKTPHQLLLEEQGADVDGGGLLLTPKQMLMEESGILPHFSQGKKVTPLKHMQAEILIEKTFRPHLAAGGQPAVHPELAKTWNNIFK